MFAILRSSRRVLSCDRMGKTLLIHSQVRSSPYVGVSTPLYDKRFILLPAAMNLEEAKQVASKL